MLLVHGLLGFDEISLGSTTHAYFRGVPEALAKDGQVVHVARVAPLSAVASRARQLARQIQSLGARKVNVVAHSMGGLDARYAISRLGLARGVAGLLTVGTPHRGTPLADLSADLAVRLGIARALAAGGASLGALADLTTAALARFNVEVADDPSVAYLSAVGYVRRKRRAHPLLVPSYLWLRRTAGDNDGVVPAASQRWGEVVAEVEADHWAQVGWSRHFDAPAFYVGLLRELRALGC